MKQLSIRQMTENDLELVLDWRNQEVVRMNMYNYHLITLEEHRDWFEKCKSRLDVVNLMFEIDGQAKGVISFSKIDTQSCTAEWAFYSGDLNTRGVGTFMELCALKYAFNVLKLRKLNCEVLSFNEKVIKFHKKFGFEEEGVKRAHYCRGESEFDIHLLAIFRSDWEQQAPKLENKYLSGLEVQL